MNPYDLMHVALTVQKMRDNSDKWHTADEEEQRTLSINNRALAQSLRAQYGIPVIYNTDGGTWRIGNVDGPLLFDLY